jgi:dCMP deaminase
MRPNWDEYFMAIAVLASTRSSCKHVRAGSVVVLDNRIIGTGYNGAPPGINENCLKAGCRKEQHGLEYGKTFDTGKCVAVHAEMNALANLTRGIHHGATLYTTVLPCPPCAKNLLAYNIKRIVYMGNYDSEESKLSMARFKEAGVQVDRLDLSKERLKEMVFDTKMRLFDAFTQS